MSSILTNNSAMVALQTMRSINSNLDQTQSQISTGKAVDNARDNAAVWAISRVMESDVAGFKSISDSLALGQSTVSVARQAAETVTDLLTDMKGLIVAAQEENVDRDKIQTDVDALRQQITSVVGAAQFNGQNLVNGSSNDPMEILSSLDRNASGNVAPSTFEVNRQNLSVTAGDPPTFGGADITGAIGGPGAFLSGAGTTTTGGDAPTPVDVSASQTITIGQVADQIGYEITLADIQISSADGGTATGERVFQFVASADDSTADVARNLAQQINAFFGAAAGADYSVTFDDNQLTIVNDSGVDIGVGLRATAGGAAGATGGAGLAGLSTLDVSTATGATGALAAIEGLIQTSINAAAAFGSAESRIETQSNFVSRLSDTLTSGIGSMVDADLEEASARLQALQVQQQLATQSLSIANQQPQNILALFR